MGFTYTFDNATLIDAAPIDNCFCSKATRGIYDEENCYLDGVLDLQFCQGLIFFNLFFILKLFCRSTIAFILSSLFMG